MTPENSIFICYRRDDSNSATYSIADRLKLAFGEKAVFWDHAGFQGGDEWREKTRQVVPNALAVVVVIHKDWINIGRNRMKDPNDPVRQELQMAADSPNCVIIPVTIDTTRSPGTHDLESIRAEVGGRDEQLLNLLGSLFAKTTIKIRFTKDFETDIQALIRRLDEIPQLDQVGSSTSFDVSGLNVIRPSFAMPKHQAGKTSSAKASDLWILQAKYRSIPMIGRDADLHGLLEWLDGEPRISARLLIGKAGAGKTRLGFEFLWEIFKERAHQWDAGLVVADSIRQISDWNAFTWHRPTVLMLDYALAIAEPVRKMFMALALKAIDSNLPPLRILLIEREASTESGWFRTLLEAENSAGGLPVRDLFEPPEPVTLQPLETAAKRRTLLEGVLQLAHEHDGRPLVRMPSQGENASFDEQLEEQRWSDPLYLMMAALVASLPSRSEQNHLMRALSLGRADLATEVAKHEIRRLEALMPVAPGHESTRLLLAHLAACATLCGGLTAEQAQQVAEEETQALGLSCPLGPGALAKLLSETLPDEDHAVSTIQPDIIAEALVIQLLLNQGHSSSQQESVVLRSAHRDAESVATLLFHAFQNFAENDRTASALLLWIEKFVESGITTTPEWLLAIEECLPRKSIALRELSAQVTHTLCERMRGELAQHEQAIEPEFARILNNLSVRLSDVGRREEALTAAQESADHYRQLTYCNSDEFTPQLATSLNTLATCLRDVGRLEEALKVALELVELRRLLAKLNSVAFIPALANSLINLANSFSTLGRREEALTSAQESAILFRELANRNPEAFAPELAISQHALSSMLSNLGRREEALIQAQESADLYRHLAKQNPDAFTPALATSLNNLAIRLSQLGRRLDALAVARESIKFRRELATRNPDAFTPDLAMSLNNLAAMLNENGCHEDALVASQESVEHYRQLAKQNSDAFTPDLATSLTNFAIKLSNIGRHEDALVAAQESADLYRQLANLNSDAFTPDLALSLNNLANRLSKLGHHEEAFAAAEESASLYRQLAEQYPDTFTPNLATSLSNLAHWMNAVGRQDDALIEARESVDLYRQLVTRNPDAFTSGMTMSLGTLASILELNEEIERARSIYREGVEILAPMFHKMPNAFSGPMRSLVYSYIRCAKKTNTDLDMELLEPVQTLLRRIGESANQNEDG